MVPTLNITINNISVIFPYYFKTRYKFVVFSLWISNLNENCPYLKLTYIYFPKLSGQVPLTPTCNVQDIDLKVPLFGRGGISEDLKSLGLPSDTVLQFLLISPANLQTLN